MTWTGEASLPSSSIPIFVLAGGPSAGKSSILAALRERYPMLEYVDETATLLLSGGFPIVEQCGLPYEDWHRYFQAAVSHVQQQREALALTVAARRGARAIVCDRGLLDGAAYFPGGLTAFLETIAFPLEQVHQRYHAVWHVPSLAVTHPTRHSKASNPHRRENVAEARDAEFRIAHVWSTHPRWVRLNGETLDDRVRACEHQLQILLPGLITRHPGALA